jgi:hypothetical protein
MLRDVEVTHQIFQELELAWLPPEVQALEVQKLFVGGPIPLEWLARVNVAVNTAVVALIVKMASDMTRRQPICIPRAVWQLFDLAPSARKRALDALEKARIIRTERKPGHAVRIWLLDKPMDRDLRGS